MAKRRLALVSSEDDEAAAPPRKQRIKRTALQTPASGDAPAHDASNVSAPNVVSTSRRVHYVLLSLKSHLTVLPRPSDPLALSLDQDLLETPILSRLHLKIHKQSALIVCMLCNAGLILSHVHTHVTATEISIRVQSQVSANPTETKTYYNTTLHQMIPGFTKPKLKVAIQEEVKKLLNIATIWDWPGDQKRNDERWRKSAWPSEGQPLPLKGLQILEGIVCLLCKGSRPHCTSTMGSMEKHLQSHGKVKKGESTRKSLVQSKSQTSSYVCWFPVPGETLPVQAAVANIRETGIQDILPDVDGDSDAAWDEMLDRQQTSLVPSSTAVIKPGVSNEKTLLPFHRDYRIHDFLSRHSYEECLSLASVTDCKQAIKPRRLKRLSGAVADTFYQDCEMTLQMAPSLRRLIVQSDP